MPMAAPRPCSQSGCGALATVGAYCEAHRRARQQSYDQQRGSAQARDYGARWRRLRSAILSRDPLCKAPGCTEPATDVDHIVPRKRGGTDDPSNLQGLCHSHHSRKTATEDGRWG